MYRGRDRYAVSGTSIPLFPSADKASAEIINLSAILNLPKGTEFFASDIHGEYEAFSHTLRNGSGSIRLKIDDVFGDSLSENEKRSLATLIYYPREKMELVLSQVDDAEAWYAVTLQRLVAVCKRAAQKSHALARPQGAAEGFRLHHRGADDGEPPRR